MKRKKFYFQSKPELEHAIQSLGVRYPQLQTNFIPDVIHESLDKEDGNNRVGVCHQVLFVEAMNSTIFDIALTDFVKQLGGLPA